MKYEGALEYPRQLSEANGADSGPPTGGQGGMVEPLNDDCRATENADRAKSGEIIRP